MILITLLSLFNVLYAGISPGTIQITKDPLSTYQWPLHFSGQKIIREIDDITSYEVDGTLSANDSIDLFVKKLESEIKTEPIVAVIDSGIDLDHEDLQTSLFKNEVECDGGKLPYPSNVDRDGNGFPGDCMGWNFTAAALGDNRPYDDKGHGTHVAGVIAATRDNRIGIAGVSNKIKILPLKVLKGKENSETVMASSLTERVANAIHYAIKMNATVINLSLGWPKNLNSEKVTKAVKEAASKGIILIAAAGNNGTTALNYPCLYEEVICVGATTIDGTIAPFSNSGSSVDIYAPGEAILSTFPKKITSMLFSVQGYEIKNGTSQAAPFVSAIIALMKATNPTLPAFELLSQISNNRFLSLKSNESRKTSTLWPRLKGLNTITVNPDGLITLPITISNRTDDELFSEVEITLTSQKTKETLLTNLSTQTISGQNEITVTTHATLNSFAIDNRAILVVRIDDQKHEVPVELIKKMDQDKIISVKLSRMNPTLAVNTVSDRFLIDSHPSYFQSSTDKNGTTLKLFHLNNQTSIEKSYPADEKVVSLQKVDLNLDGTFDLLLRTLDSKKKIIRYYYLDKELNPLFKNHSSVFDFLPEVYAFDPSVTYFAKTKVDGITLLVPLSVGVGFVPSADRSSDPFNPTPLEKERHLYYLAPDFQTQTFTTRIVDNLKFRHSLTPMLLNYDDSISIISLYGEASSFSTDSFSLLIALGNSANGSTYLASIKNFELNQLSGHSLSYPMAISGQPLSMIEIGDKNREHVGKNFNSLQNSTLFLHEGTEDELIYNHSDSIIAFMPSFMNEDSELTAFQTKRELVLLGNTTQSYPIKRTSFLDSDKFTELFLALPLNKQPAFYVDASAINANHVYFLTYHDDGVSVPLSHSLEIPSGCLSMNPTRLNGRLHVSFKCTQKNELSIYFLAVE